jgi:hypothetical protein
MHCRAGLLDSACGGYGFPGTVKPWRTVGLSAQDTFEAALPQESFDDGGSWRPASHVARSSGGPKTQTTGEDRICWMSASAAAAQRAGLERVTFTGKPIRCSARSAAS